MNNKQYIAKYWQLVDLELKKLLKFTQSNRFALVDELQIIFDRFHAVELNRYINRRNLTMLHRQIDRWENQGLNIGYGKLLMRDLKNRSRIRGDEMLFIFLLATITDNYRSISDTANKSFKRVAKSAYKNARAQAQSVTRKKSKGVVPNVDEVLEQPMPSGQIYVPSLLNDAKYRAEQITQRARADEQQGRRTSVHNPDLQRALKAQENWQLRCTATTSEGKYAGYYDMVMSFIVGHTVAQAFIDAGVKKYQFIATVDDRTTTECKKLHLKIINMSELKLGINAPPVYPPPHPCRSVIRAVE